MGSSKAPQKAPFSRRNTVSSHYTATVQYIAAALYEQRNTTTYSRYLNYSSTALAVHMAAEETCHGLKSMFGVFRKYTHSYPVQCSHTFQSTRRDISATNPKYSSYKTRSISEHLLSMSLTSTSARDSLKAMYLTQRSELLGSAIISLSKSPAVSGAPSWNQHNRKHNKNIIVSISPGIKNHERKA